MQYLIDYGLFLAKIATVVVAILITIAGIIAISSKGQDKNKGKLKIKKLNEKFLEVKKQLQQDTLSKPKLKQFLKQEKDTLKKLKKASDEHPRKRIFVLHFHGDVRATKVADLTEEINGLLTIATPDDEVVVCLESGGGLVHAYGLGASQLARIRNKKIPLTVIIDKVAASGGYMMACVANQIVAAPFSIIGSIGVLAQLPNFHRFLKHHNIDFEQLHAGEYKRTLTLFGENTSKARKKMQEELEDVHYLFKEFIIENRPQLDIDKVATGEHWLGIRAYDLRLVDSIGTSDDYLLKAVEDFDIYSLHYVHKKNFSEKISSVVQMTLHKIVSVWQQENDDSRLF